MLTTKVQLAVFLDTFVNQLISGILNVYQVIQTTIKQRKKQQQRKQQKRLQQRKQLLKINKQHLMLQVILLFLKLKRKLL